MPELHTKLTASSAVYDATLRKATVEAEKFAKNVAANLKGFISAPLRQIAYAAAGFLTYETFKEGIKGSIEMGTQLEKLHKRTGIAVSSLVMLKKTFRDNDVDAENLGQTINKMQRSIAQGSAAFQGLGIATEHLRVMNPSDQFNTIAKAIGRIPDPAERAAKAMQIFGRSGGELLPIFENLDSLGSGLSYKAKLFESVSKSFEEITVNFRQAADNLSTIFLGITAQAKDQINYIAQMLKSPDFLGIGLKIGKYFKEGLNIFIGATGNLNVAWDMIKEGISYAFLSGLNYLAAGLKSIRLYFQDGMLETFQGLGMMIESVLLKAFAVPIAYFQAGIDEVLSKIPASLGGNGEYDARKAAAAREADYTQQANFGLDNAKKYHGKDSYIESVYLDYAKQQQKLALEAHQIANGGKTVEQRAQDYLSGPGPRINNAGKEYTADELGAQGLDLLKYGLGKAKESIASTPYVDIFGAGQHGAQAAADASLLRQAGQKKAVTELSYEQQQNASRLGYNTGLFGRAKALELAGALPDAPNPLSEVQKNNYRQSHGQYALDQYLKQAPSERAILGVPTSQTSGGYSYAPAGTGVSDLAHGYHTIRRGDAAAARAAEHASQNKSTPADLILQIMQKTIVPAFDGSNG